MIQRKRTLLRRELGAASVARAPPSLHNLYQPGLAACLAPNAHTKLGYVHRRSGLLQPRGTRMSLFLDLTPHKIRLVHLETALVLTSELLADRKCNVWGWAAVVKCHLCRLKRLYLCLASSPVWQWYTEFFFCL